MFGVVMVVCWVWGGDVLGLGWWWCAEFWGGGGVLSFGVVVC